MQIQSTNIEKVSKYESIQTVHGRCWYCGKLWEAKRLITFSSFCCLQEIKEE
jgi:hypothetical protein